MGIRSIITRALGLPSTEACAPRRVVAAPNTLICTTRQAERAALGYTSGQDWFERAPIDLLVQEMALTPFDATREDDLQHYVRMALAFRRPDLMTEALKAGARIEIGLKAYATPDLIAALQAEHEKHDTLSRQRAIALEADEGPMRRRGLAS